MAARDLNRRVADEVRSIVDDVDARIGPTDDGYDVIVAALTKAMLLGLRLGATEIAAQAIEQGADIRLYLAVDDPDLDALLAP